MRLVRFGFHPQARDLADLAAGISRAAATASALITETEPDFLRLANDLKELYACATELGRSTDRQMVSLRDTVGETRLSGADGLAGVLIEGLQSAITDTETEADSLKSICAALLRLVHLGGHIGLTSIFLNTARYNFRVESARTEATRQAFGAFAEELEPLAEQIGAVGEAVSGQAKSAYLELGGLVRAIRGGSEQLRGITAHTGLEVERTCARGQALLDSSLTTLKQSSDRARQRDRLAQEAVYHVQFGDIVRQKIEHIAEALRETAETLAAIGPKSARSALCAQADKVLAIQLSQIALIVAEISGARQKLPCAFAALGEETEALAGSLRSLGRNEIFENLAAGLHHLEELELRGRAMREQSRASWKRALETSRESSRHMEQLREINFRMHLQSLNAILKTEWLGAEGCTLGVLSSHMHTLFSESSGLVADTASVLESISRQTECPDDPAADLKTSLDRGLLAVSRLQGEFSRTIEAAEQMALRQAAQLKRADNSVVFLDSLLGRIEDLAGEIEGLRKKITPMCGDARSVAQRQIVDERYTMESEREVHRRQFMDAEPETAAASQESELGDNVDFF